MNKQRKRVATINANELAIMLRLAVEFGYKGCECGESLDATLGNFSAIISQPPEALHDAQTRH